MGWGRGWGWGVEAMEEGSDSVLPCGCTIAIDSPQQWTIANRCRQITETVEFPTHTLRLMTFASSPQPMTYDKLLVSERCRESSVKDRDLGTEVLSDASRIVTSTPFRRLQTKAQVFSLEQNAAVRSRLTHTLEVAMYGGLIAREVFKGLNAAKVINSELELPFVKTVENACLLHDIGNPPFGHLGEFAMQDWFVAKEHVIKGLWSGCAIDSDTVSRHYDSFRYFDGNSQGFRIVSRLAWLQDEWGLNLTCTLMATMVKYMSTRPDGEIPFRKKAGFFESECVRIEDIWKRLGLKWDDEEHRPIQRHPLTFLMEAADDIAYCVSDIEDAIEKRVVTADEFLSALPIADAGLQRFKRTAEEQVLKNIAARDAKFRLFRIELTRELVKRAASCYVNNHVQILEGEFKVQLLESDAEAKAWLGALKSFSKTKIFVADEAVRIELSGFRIVSRLLDAFERLLHLEQVAFIQLLPGADRAPSGGDLALEKRLASLLPNKHVLNYQTQCKADGDLERIWRVHLVVDNIASMTDSHAVKVFRMLDGISAGGGT